MVEENSNQDETTSETSKKVTADHDDNSVYIFS